MRKIILGVALFSALLSAGKITWNDNGTPTIAGLAGQGCSQGGFGAEDNKTKKCK